ncbi:MAG: MarR family winged helix-turn-helix transcriptional regulator [Flavobacteriales bacterium]
MHPEETIDFHIRWAWAKMSKAYNVEAAKKGGTMAMAFLLLNIDKEGTPATSLGPKMGMEPTSLTRILKTLEADGYIERKPAKDDGRKVLVSLTQKGKNYRDVSKQKVIQMNERMRSAIPQNKLNTFFEVIQTINKELDKNNIFS